MRVDVRIPITAALTSILVSLTASSCVIHESRSLTDPTPVIRVNHPVRAWNVMSASGPVGVVVHFQAPGNKQEGFYSVRNQWSQDLGMIDQLGRAWAFKPHEREADWIGTGTLAAGAARILGEDECELLEIELNQLEAPPH